MDYPQMHCTVLSEMICKKCTQVLCFPLCDLHLLKITSTTYPGMRALGYVSMTRFAAAALLSCCNTDTYGFPLVVTDGRSKHQVYKKPHPV